ncbi:TonB-dependent receptor [uncultured Arcticibacterium sp.]|uniref:TonB-dependent receptor n=1 Tax=uncultured Arcticibacterium sp. TaxID=2173042 RepID=UPI0030F7F1C4
MKKIVYILLFIIGGFNVNAQLFCSGQVLDSLTNLPLEGASIVLNHQGKNSGVKSDAEGKFYIKLPYADNAVQVRYTGYIAKWIYLKKGVSLIDGMIKMEEVSNTLEQVIVSTKGFDQNVRKPVLGANSINMKTLEKIPAAFGEVDLFRSIQMLPGVTSVGEASNGVNIRGGTTDQNLILIDDTPVFNPTHMFGLFSVTPPDAVRNLDLYKGNVPARYGGRAASVMDVSLLNPDLTRFKAKGGISLISEKLMLNVPIVKDRFGVYVAGRGSNHDVILPIISDELESIKTKFGELVGKAFWRVNDKNTFTAMGYYSSDYFETDLLANLPNVVGTTTYFQHNTLNGSAKWSHIFNEKLDLQASVIVADYKPNIATKEAETGNPIKLESGILQKQIKTNLYYQTEKHKTEGGLIFTNYALNPGRLNPGVSTSVNEIQTPSEKGNELAAYIDDEFAISDDLAISMGLRYSYFYNYGAAEVRSYRVGEPRDDFSVEQVTSYGIGEKIENYGGLEPRFGLRYSISPKRSLKFGYNLMRQYLQIVSNTTTPIPTSRWKTVDTNIKPQVSNLFTAGYYHAFEDDIYEATLEAYYRSTQNIMDYKPGADFLLQQFPETQLVQGQSKAYGLELMVSKKKGVLTGWANYTYARTFNRVDASVNASELVNGGDWYAANYDKPHTFNTSLDFNVDEHNSFSFNFVYSTGRPYTQPVGFVSYLNSLYPFYDQRNNERVPDYHRLDFSWNIYNPSMKKRRWQGRWAFSVYNLYAHKNVYSVYFKTEDSQTKAYKLQILGAPIVSLAYNFTFE